MHDVYSSRTGSRPVIESPEARTLRRQRLADLIKLVDEWMADESGYDEETLPALKAALDANRGSQRKLFSDSPGA